MSRIDSGAYKDSDNISFRMLFKRGTVIVGFQDLLFGVSWLTWSVRNLMDHFNRGEKLPLLGIYVENGEGYRWKAPPQLKSHYGNLTFHQDPFRVQYPIVALLVVELFALLFSMLLLLGVMKENRTLIRCWAILNGFFSVVLYFAILISAISEYHIGIASIFGLPVVAIRATQVWITHNYCSALTIQHKNSLHKPETARTSNRATVTFRLNVGNRGLEEHLHV